MREKRLVAFLLTALSLALSVLLAWGAIKYLLPCILPFLLAFLTAWLLEPVAGYLRKHLHFRRSFASAVCVTFLLLAIIGVLSLIISRLIYQAINFFRELPSLLSGIPPLIENLEETFNRYIKSAPMEMQEYLSGAMDGMAQKTTEIPARLSESAISLLTHWAGNTPGTLLFCAAYAIGSYFISRNYSDIKYFVIRQIPLRFRDQAKNLKRDLLDGIVLWLKAQLTLICLTFLELFIALTFLGFRYSALIALITALIDALPILGSGIVLIPWALMLFLTGSSTRAVGLIATSLLVTTARSFLEPRLVGAKFGVNPAATLFSMYTGFRLCGVWGMVLFPLALLLLKQMNDKGYIKLWK